MTARHQPHSSNGGEYHEYRMRERIERGEKVVGVEAEWLDRRGPAATAARRADADRRHEKRRS